MSTAVKLSLLTLVVCICLTGCRKDGSVQAPHPLGERVTLGPLTYTVIDSSWKPQLGEGFNVRSPQQRFLVLTVSVTNGGGKDVGIPLLQLDGANGQSYQEVENGTGVDNWLGLIRNITPAQTQQGRILFDVPLTSYRLRLTDGGEPGFEKYAWVDIPLKIDSDTSDFQPSARDGFK